MIRSYCRHSHSLNLFDEASPQKGPNQTLQKLYSFWYRTYCKSIVRSRRVRRRRTKQKLISTAYLARSCGMVRGTPSRTFEISKTHVDSLSRRNENLLHSVESSHGNCTYQDFYKSCSRTGWTILCASFIIIQWSSVTGTAADATNWTVFTALGKIDKPKRLCPLFLSVL